MKKIGIIYASMTGNTEDIARLLGEKLGKFEVKYLEMDDMQAEDLDQYDGLLLGSYTYGDGDLPFESEDFFDQLDNIDLKGKVVGCFGSGDTDYDQYCAAVDQFQEKVLQREAKGLDQVLKIEFAPEEQIQLEACYSFIQVFIEQIEANRVKN